MDDITDIFSPFCVDFTKLYRKLQRELCKDTKFESSDVKTTRDEYNSKRKMASKRLDKFLTGLVWFNRTLEVLSSHDETVRIIFRDADRRDVLLDFINKFNKLKTFNLDACFSARYDDVEDDFSDTLEELLIDSKPLTDWMRAPFTDDRHLP